MPTPKNKHEQAKIIVDTNIIFSALLNTKGNIGNVLFDSDATFNFYSCSYMRHEIAKHWNKLKKISKLSDNELQESCFNLFSKIHFIDEALIPEVTWLEAERLVSDVDIDDTDFIALTSYLKGFLWSGDKELYIGLKSKGFERVLYTSEIIELGALINTSDGLLNL